MCSVSYIVLCIAVLVPVLYTYIQSNSVITKPTVAKNSFVVTVVHCSFFFQLLHTSEFRKSRTLFQDVNILAEAN